MYTINGNINFFCWGAKTMKQKKAILYIFISTIFLIINSSELKSFCFIAEADTHAGSDAKAARKAGHLQAMLEIIRNPYQDIKFLCFPGDLTDTGNASSSFLCKSIENEWEEFCHNWLYPLETAKPATISKTDFVKLCQGNHDNKESIWQTDTAAKIKNRHGSHHYSFNVDGVHFICCGKYPDAKTRAWVQSDLQQLKDPNTPIFMFWHFNFEGPFSDWWSQTEKNHLYQIIQNHNVKLIITGHWHKSYASNWNNIPVIGVGGSYFSLIDYEPTTNQLNITFHKPASNAIRDFKSMFRTL